MLRSLETAPTTQTQISPMGGLEIGELNTANLTLAKKFMEDRKEMFLEVSYDVEITDQDQTRKLRKHINLCEVAFNFIMSFLQCPDKPDYFRFSIVIFPYL